MKLIHRDRYASGNDIEWRKGSMNQGRKTSGIWFVLFWVSFVIMVISVAILLWQHIGTETANIQFEEMQSEANARMEDDAEEVVYDREMTETEQTVEAEQPKQTENAAQAERSERAEQTEEHRSSEKTDVSAVQQNIEETAETEPPVQTPEKTLDWAALHSQNPDIYAWIYVPDTGVDYPVVQHPTDNSYYLNHNLNGSKGYPGCIYTENFNRRDFSDTHTVLYGHNLKDKTMFSTLHNFEDPQLLQKEHYIYLYTEEAEFAYRIFAAYEFSSIHLLDNYDYTNAYVYEDFLRQIRQAAGNIRQDVEVTAKDRIITLSTCTADHDAARRYLVTGVLVSEKGR